MTKEQIGYLLDTCSKYPEIYNEISRDIYKDFEICSAELVLLVTYYIIKERNK